MEFGITQEIDVEAERKSNLITALSNLLKSFFVRKGYGIDIEHFFIGVICIKDRPGYEDWFKVRKPRYKAIQKTKQFDGQIKESHGVYSYDIKLDFEQFVTSSDAASQQLLISEILKSLTHLDNLPKKIKDFDKEQFKHDLSSFLKESEIN